MQCECGREVAPRHCPNCGRKDVYAIRRGDKLVLIEGTKYIVRGFRCRNCGTEFDEGTKCEAPRRGLSIAAQRVGDKAASVLVEMSEDDRKNMLTKLFGGSKDNVRRKIAESHQTKPFEIGDDRGVIEETLSKSGITIEEAKASVSLDKEDGETQIIEEKKP